MAFTIKVIGKPSYDTYATLTVETQREIDDVIGMAFKNMIVVEDIGIGVEISQTITNKQLSAIGVENATN